MTSRSDASQAKAALVEQVQERVAAGASTSRADQARYFAGAFLRRVPATEIRDESPDTVASLVAGVMKFAGMRPPGASTVRAFNPDPDRDGWSSSHTIVEMVNPDRPFLVDTANLVLSELDLGVHIIVHPVIHARRDKRGRLLEWHPTADGKGEPESIMHLQVDRQTDPERLRLIEHRLEVALQHVALAVEDWKAMRERLTETVESLPGWAAHADPSDLEECQAFLSWLRDDHFILLGARDYVVDRGDDHFNLDLVDGSGLGMLRETDRTIRSRPIATLSDGALGERTTPLIITKTRARSTVHRGGYMDYIGVLRFDDKGRISGERRFIGLFTSNAYFRRAADTPLVRLKADQVLERSELREGSYARKSLVHILETLPRDDLFQASVDEIEEMALAVLALMERQRVRLLVRRERFHRFYSCLVYIPRDDFSTENRKRIQDILFRAFQGEQLDYTVQISESRLARLQLLIRPKPGARPEPDLKALEQRIVEAVRSWHHSLRDILVQKFGEERGLDWAADIGRAFPAAYVEDVSPWVASFDVERIAELGDEQDLKMSLYRPRGRETDIIRFKLFKRGRPIPLSQVLPILENLGLEVMNERPYQLAMADESTVWVQDYDMVYAGASALELDRVRDAFTEAFLNTWRGVTRGDGFNRLILGCGLHWREVKILRAYCKYLQQTGIPFSLAYMAATLSRHPLLGRLLVEYFEALFSPERDGESEYHRDLAARRLARDFDSMNGTAGQASDDAVMQELVQAVIDQRRDGDRAAQTKAVEAAFLRGLNGVTSLDEDRILHVFYAVIRATLRTNFYQRGLDGNPCEHLSFKLDSSRVPDLPAPRPYREIWVYSTRVEGIHLRMGPIARGGLRWSDRKADFRTEVLGLMKAQNVKNTMIVPVGAKGGFVPMQLPEAGGREAVMEEGTACYKIFINGLLDVTDNLDEEEVIPPKDLVRRDGDDPYLVVAADKGTATFSDTANAIAEERGFWMGDAFASGGSVGYDHKGMGITAKGAWEGVKRHFRELGTDIQREPFTVVGIGDMSGDVFGNGMLLSRQIRLKAAFNHLHIFLDPDPDEATSFKERKRLFELPRSGWNDYNTDLISAGGGVFSRQDKSIELSKPVREWLGIEDEQLAPNDLIRALLKSDVDLLWNGGIGTYVKSSRESNSDVGDLANNPVRVNGADLRCRVIGEGGNLGVTQLGRVEYARAGGHINTDFIDNSAGVDCSDHEVNIKLLLDQAMSADLLGLEARNKLLAEMTDEVEALVLRSNYLQTQSLSMMERLSPTRIGAKQRFLDILEDEGLLDRELEYLPDDDELVERRNRGEGLYRPELSVMLSYSKIRLYQQLLDSDVPEDPFLSAELARYFPEPLRERFPELIEAHRLRREIVATQVTNSLVNRMGISFVVRMREDTGAGANKLARAYTVARELLDAREFWDRVEALDNTVSADLQIDAMLVLWHQLRQVTRWLANLPGHELEIEPMIERLRPGLDAIQKDLYGSLDAAERDGVQGTEQRYLDAGFPKRLARRIALLPFVFPLLDVVETAAESGLDIKQVAGVYAGLGKCLGLKWLRAEVESLRVQGQWHAQARGNLRDELYAHHRELVDAAIRSCGIEGDPVACWIGKHAEDVRRVTDMMEDIRNLEQLDYATASVAVRSLGQLVSATT
ncbi:MAG: NAD-glutamate dehydrogenase [Xanthomonadales bacterium]|jgi:glutamate dehydrogenase|nr:NAD-glutamate dehydrogenase [Xanthomonadales bacterium]